MKAKPSVRFAIMLSWAMTVSVLLDSTDTYSKSGPSQGNSEDVCVIITRYEIQQSAKARMSRRLDAYVRIALSDENNVMAEFFQEDDQPFVLWVLERWKRREHYQEFTQRADVRMLSVPQSVLFRPIERYYLKDLAPLSRNEWRRAPGNDDKPIVVMLFVDSKPGTESAFIRVYDEAMPKFRSEPGVITYGLAQSEDDASQFVTYEKFRNEDAFKFHLSFPPIQPVLDYLNTSIKKQPFQTGLHRLVPVTP